MMIGRQLYYVLAFLASRLCSQRFTHSSDTDLHVLPTSPSLCESGHAGLLKGSLQVKAAF